MKCPRCRNELRRSKKDPSYGLCDVCRKKYRWRDDYIEDFDMVPQKKIAPQSDGIQRKNGLICPICQSNNITISFQNVAQKSKGRAEIRKKSIVTRTGNSFGRKFLIFSTGGLWALTPKKSNYSETRKEKTKIINDKFAICQDCGNSWKVAPNHPKHSLKTGIAACVFIIFIFSIFSAFWNSNSENAEKDDLKISNLSAFDYTELSENTIRLNSYKGHEKSIIINSNYDINGNNYIVTELKNSIFNGCDANIVFIPGSLSILYDDTLAYLNAEHIELYYEGTEEQWNSIFTNYEPSSASEEFENGNYEEAGTALADKLNDSIGHKFDESKFSMHFESNVNDIL